MKQIPFDSFIKHRDQLALHKISNSKDLRGKNRNDSEDILSINSVSGSVASFSLGQALNPNYIKNKGGSKFLKDTLVYLVKDSLKQKKYEDFLKRITEAEYEIIQNADNIDEFLLKKVKDEGYGDTELERWLRNSFKNSKLIYDVAREGVERSAGAYEKQYIKPEKLINFVKNKNFCDSGDLKSIIEDVIFKKKKKDSSDVANLETISQILAAEEDINKLVNYINNGGGDAEENEKVRGLVDKVLNNPKIIPNLGYAKVLNNPKLANLFNKVVKFKPQTKSDKDYKDSFNSLNNNIAHILKQSTQGNSNDELSFRIKLKAFQGKINKYRNKIKIQEQRKGNINLNKEELNVKLLDVIKGSGLDGKMIHDLHEIAESMTEPKLIGAIKIADGIKDYIEHICGGRLISDSKFEKQFFKDGKIQHNINTDSWISSDSKPQDSVIRNFAKKVANGITSSFNLNNRNGANKNTKAVGVAISAIVAVIACIIAAMSGAGIIAILAPLALPVLTGGLTLISTLRSKANISKNTSKFIENGVDLVEHEVNKNKQNIPISRQNSGQSTAQSTERSVNSLDSSSIGDYRDSSKKQTNRRLKYLIHEGESTDGGESLYNKSSYGNNMQKMIRGNKQVIRGKKQTAYYTAKAAKEILKKREI